jgi:hypothetical protein
MLTNGKRLRYHASNGSVYRQWSQQTVCTRNVREVHQRRLDIERSAEEFLKSRGELTHERQRAINQARFEIARMVWQYSPALAGEIMDKVHSAEPGFVPSGAAPGAYRFLYQQLGFRAAERIADWRRRWLPRQGGR